MKLRSAPILGCVTLLFTLAMDYRFDCKDIAAAGLMDGLWYSAAVRAAEQADARLQSEIDGLENELGDLSDRVDQQAGQVQSGIDGLERELRDLSDRVDQQAGQVQPPVPGPKGDPGADGADGAGGTDGVDGADGANCWDFVGDVNGDGVIDWKDCIAFAEGGGENDGVIARAVIDEWGYVRPGGVNISGEYGGGSTRFANGQYMLNINLSGVRADLNQVDPIDFPVFVTVRATSASNLPWEDDISALVAHYRFDRFDGQPALDVAGKRLSMQVFLLRAVDGKPMSAKFSVLVFEPEP